MWGLRDFLLAGLLFSDFSCRGVFISLKLIFGEVSCEGVPPPAPADDRTVSYFRIDTELDIFPMFNIIFLMALRYFF